MIINKRFGLSVALVSFTALVACCSGVATNNSSDQANDLFDEMFMESLRESPESMTYMGMRERYSEWDDYSQEAADESIARDKKHLAQLDAIDADSLDQSASLSLTLYRQRLQNSIDDVRWRHHRYPVNQMRGMHSGIPSFLINQHLIANLEEAQAYIARINGVPVLIADVIKDLRIRQENGILAPQFAFTHSVRDSQNIIAGIDDDSAAENPLVTDFNSKIAGLEIDGAVKAELREQLAKALLEQLAPAYRTLVQALNEMAEQAEGNFGVWRLPKGDAYYNNRLKRMTTTDLTAEQIHALGLAEVKRIHQSMRDIIQAVGFDGNLQAFFEFMRTDKQFSYGSSDVNKAAYLKDATQVIDSMRERLGELFYSKPKAPLVVKAVEAFREKSAGRAFYQRAAPDGSRPGTYYANLSNMNDMRSYDLEALAYHEGIPGHHMQLSIAQEQSDLPKFRRFGGYTAYVEGWGLYSEYIPKEMGLYADPYSDFGRLSMELWRACRLVVDTGLHAKRWSREKATAYLTMNTASDESANLKAIERYMVMPGQATAYKIGMLKLLELRENARTALGDQFDIRDFHEVVLSNGAVPLNVLEDLVNQWVADTRSKPASLGAG
mgnify:CR=1 FL=1